MLREPLAAYGGEAVGKRPHHTLMPDYIDYRRSRFGHEIPLDV
jgi:hypothetical protein